MGDSQLNLAIHSLDVVVLLVYIAVVMLIGLGLGRHKHNLDDYLLGGRQIPWGAVLISIVATETSTATFLSIPGLAFDPGGDLRFLQLAIGYIVGRLIVVWLLLPLFFQRKMFTAYEVLHQRFGRSTRRVASLLFLVTRNLGDGLRLFLAAIALQKVTGMSLSLCVLSVGVATIIYTVAGGMKSVIWNDCVQFVIYMVGGVLILGWIVAELPDGLAGLGEYARAENKLVVFDFTLDFKLTYTFWAGLIGGMCLTLGTHGTDQMMVQRYLSAGSWRAAALAVGLSGVVVFFQFLLFLLVGVALSAYYATIRTDSATPEGDHALATFIVQELPAGWGLIGLLLAAVFAAAMSTLSSSLNSSAAAVVNDLLPQKKPRTPAREVLYSRLWTIVFGAVQISVGIAAQQLEGSVVANALAIAGFTSGVLLGIFSLALFPQTSQAGALAGLVTGLLVLTEVKFLTEIAWPWYPVIGAITTLVMGLLVSTLLPDTVDHTADGESK